MTQEKALFLREWTTGLEKSVQELKVSGEVLVSKEMKSTVKNTQFAETLANIASREIGRTSATAYKTFAEQLLALENQRAKVVGQLERHFSGRVEVYVERVKTQKDNVSKRNAAHEKMISKQKALMQLNTRSKRDDNAILKAKQALTEETLKLKQTETALNQSVVEFEKDKLRDYKEAMQRYVESQLFFHAKALEELTASYHTINAIDVESDVKDIARRLAEVSGHLPSELDN